MIDFANVGSAVVGAALVGALALLIAGARWFTGTAERTGQAVGLSPFAIGIFIVAIGTSLPELAVSVSAALSGRAEMAIGNILGSCIFNATTVIGLASLFGRVEVPADLMRLPLPCFGGAALLFYLLTQDRRVSRWEGLLFVFGYVLLVAEIAGLA